MLDCDECHRWFHAVCVGFIREQTIADYWACDDCVMRKQLSAQKERLQARKAAAAAALGSKKKGATSPTAGSSPQEAEGEKMLREFSVLFGHEKLRDTGA